MDASGAPIPQPTYENRFVEDLASARTVATMRIERLVDQAQQIAERYNGQMIEEHNQRFSRDNPNWNRLFPTVKVAQSNRCYIYWNRWTGYRKLSGPNKQRTGTHIRSGSRRGGYKASTLARYAQDWELPIAQATEREFDGIRRQLFTLYGLIDSIDAAASDFRSFEGHEERDA